MRCSFQNLVVSHSAVEGAVNFIADMKVYRNHRMSSTSVRESRRNYYLQESRPYFHKVIPCFGI